MGYLRFYKTSLIKISYNEFSPDTILFSSMTYHTFLQFLLPFALKYIKTKIVLFVSKVVYLFCGIVLVLILYLFHLSHFKHILRKQKKKNVCCAVLA